MKNISSKIFLFLVFVSLFFNGCKKDKEEGIQQDTIYQYIYELMNAVYLWNDKIPSVEYPSYTDPQKLMDDMAYYKDHWSFVGNTKTINSYFLEGEEFGFGFGLGWDGDPSNATTRLRVMYVYENSEAGRKGIKRGWIINNIDNINVRDIADFDILFNGVSATKVFTCTDNSGKAVDLTLSKSTYALNAVLYSDTYLVNGKKTGYFVYQSFLNYSEDELDEAISFLKAENIEELVVDLRYNTGGAVSIAEELSNIIVPENSDGKTMYTMTHNKDRATDWDTTITFKSNSQNLNLNRVFFLVNSYSASASELLINNLKPHMEVKLIGDSTYGKPVAMYGFEHEDWSIYPVTAVSLNADNEGEYYGGIAPDKYVIDYFKFDWGDETEPALSQAFYYISNGIWNETISLSLKSSDKPSVIESGHLGENLLIMNR